MKILSVIISLFLLLPFNVNAELPSSKQQITLSFAPLVKQISPAVVNIYTKRAVPERTNHPFMNDPFFSRFFGNNRSTQRKRIQNSLGSGVIVDHEGLVVTNAHVIEAADEIKVILNDGREFVARLVLKDPKIDLALLRMEIDGEQLPVAPIISSENMEVGDLVLAIGNPFGVGQSVTSGIVSAVARSASSINDFNFFIQTDAAINPGNSGGALVNMSGGVIGINTAIYSRDGGSLGIGFAIPSEMVATMIAAEKSGNISANGIIRPWLGITSQNLTPDIAESIGMDRPQGAMIVKLHDQSPMKKAGLMVGDVIISLDDKKIRTSAELRFRMSMVPIGNMASIKIVSLGKERIVEVKSQAPSNKPATNPTKIEGENILSGAIIANINPALAYELDISIDLNGIIINDIDRGSYASRFLQIGDILLEINGHEIKTIKDAKEAVKNNHQGYWKLVFNRKGKIQTLVLR